MRDAQLQVGPSDCLKRLHDKSGCRRSTGRFNHQ